MNTPQQLNYNQCIDNLIDSYSFSEEEIEKDVIKDCLLALPNVCINAVANQIF